MYQRQNTPVNFRALQIITLALPGGAALFLLTTFLINKDRLMLMPDGINNAVIYIALAFGVIFSVISVLIFNIILQKIDTSVLAKEKFPKYVAAYITRFALIEAAALFNSVAFLLSGCLLNAGMALALVVLMLSARPQRAKATEDLKIYYPDSLD